MSEREEEEEKKQKKETTTTNDDEEEETDDGDNGSENDDDDGLHRHRLLLLRIVESASEIHRGRPGRCENLRERSKKIIVAGTKKYSKNDERDALD